jgi:capsule polysaccharide export protein KpsE/RkpR
MPITCFVLEGQDEEFSAFSIEEIEVPIDPEEGISVFDLGYQPKEAKSVASVVVTGKNPEIAKIVAGIESSQKALAQDEIERAAKKAAAEKEEETK